MNEIESIDRRFNMFTGKIFFIVSFEYREIIIDLEEIQESFISHSRFEDRFIAIKAVKEYVKENPQVLI